MKTLDWLKLALWMPALIVAACGNESPDSTASVAENDALALGTLTAAMATLERRTERLRDIAALERLQRAYGYYLDRADWDNITDLFADDATAEYGMNGVYRGKDSIRNLLYALGGGQKGLRPEQLNDHIQLQPVIDITPDGRAARARWRVLGLLGQYQQYARWQEGPYENEYIKQDGVWKIYAIRWKEDFTVPFKGGLTTTLDAADLTPLELPEPDAPSTLAYRSWPVVSLLPFHFPNPVTGSEPVLPELGAATIVRETAEGLATRAAVLAAKVERLDDEREIEIVQRTYGYYVDKNLWGQIADLFTEDGTLEIGGRGVFVGRDRALEYLEWLGEPEHGRLYDHTQMDGVVTVSPDGKTAKGRWRALVFGGNEGGISVFGDCIYENEYRKEDGVWKLSRLYSYFIMYTDWDQGWRTRTWPNTRPEAILPPDRPPTVVYDMFPGELTAPIHYQNPVTGGDWRPIDSTTVPFVAAQPEAISSEIVTLTRRVDRLEDAHQLERLHSVYGYYLDARDWDNLADLFAADGTLETEQRGVYIGKARVRESLELFGEPGLRDGALTVNFQYQPIVHVATDGLTAKLRARSMTLGGEIGGQGIVGGSVYENTYVKENGVWKIQSAHPYTTFLADYEAGWAQGALPMAGPSEELPPDRPPSEIYAAFPTFYELPFHYDNPVSGLPPVRK